MNDEKGKFEMIELKDISFLPENSRNLIKISKKNNAGAEIVFGASSFVSQSKVQFTHSKRKAVSFCRTLL